MADRVGRTLVEFVVTTKNIFVVRLEHWALLGLSLLVKVAVSYGHEARVEGLQ